ncbi:MAG: putative zinc-binding metallopeptidase [Myxococcota bacterium]
MDLRRCAREELLDTRMCDLPLSLDGSWVQPLVERALGELRDRDLRVRPHFWLADEWFSPENVPGVALPFYLAHRRLMRLERDMMLEVEGGTRSECLQLIRHELGHAMQHAYQLHRRRRWQQLFGKASEPYPEFYKPRASSRRFVVHLDGWYAQAHPVEDFAETFAVWLGTSPGKWRSAYRNWPALEKLEYVDELMAEVAGCAPKVRSKARPYRLRSLKHTLREHYDRRREHYAVGYSDQFDRDLLRVFARGGKGESAVRFLRRHRRELREQVSKHTGEHAFTVDQVYKQMIGRCRELELRCGNSTSTTKLDMALILATHTLYTLHRRGDWHPV